MAAKWLHDSTGKILGRLEIQPNGDMDGYDARGAWVGRYQASSDTTHRAGGAYAGRGNLLAALITCP